MKKLFILFAILSLTSLVIAQDVSQLLEDRLKAEPVGSGITGVIVDKDGVKYYSAGTVSKEPNAAAIDKDSVFEIGSITKVFTGILLAEGIKRGEVKLNDPVSKYLPKNIKPIKYEDKEITLLDLTTHGSSLPSLPDDFAPKDQLNPYADYTVAQMYAYLGRAKLGRAIGSQFGYSNLAVGLLGHILAQEAKMGYEDLVKKRILKPLGMKNTAITFTPWMKSHLAVGHNAAGKQTSNWDLPTFAGAGAIRSTASDMAKFLSAGLGLTKTSISDSIMASQKLARTYDVPSGPSIRIGFNWITSKPGAKDIIWHNGGTGGYRSFAGLDQEAKRGVFLSENGSASVDDIGFHILDSKAPLRKIEKPKAAIAVSEEILQTYVGEYKLSEAFSIVVTRKGKELFAQATKQPQFQLFAEKEDNFFIKVVDAQVSFVKDESGKVTGLILHQGGNNTPGSKIK